MSTNIEVGEEGKSDSGEVQGSRPKPPKGLMRFFLRAPILLFRLKLGWLFGKRFILINHIGRKSGKLRQTVTEVVDYDSQTGVVYVASGWGEKSDWFQNVLKTPQVRIQLGNRVIPTLAKRLTPDEAEQFILKYSRLHPRTFQELARFMGFRLDGSEASIRAAARQLPLVGFYPQSPARSRI